MIHRDPLRTKRSFGGTVRFGAVGTAVLAAFTLAGCGASATPQPAAAQPAPKTQSAKVAPQSPGARFFFERFDLDGDGRVELADLPPRAERRWAQADTNHDGVITPAEAEKAVAARRQKRFERADTNSDGKLSQAEVGVFRWKRLVVADSNKDGFVTQKEIDEAYRQGKIQPRGWGRGAGPGWGRGGGRHGRGRGWAQGPGRGHGGGWGEGRRGCGRGWDGPRGRGYGPGNPFDWFDDDADGKITKSEVPKEVWEHLAKADANKDGAVTEAELDKARENGTMGRRGSRRGGGWCGGPGGGPWE